MPGLINLDFADVRSVMHEMGKAMMGTGEAEGDGRALEAAEKAIANPLLDGVSMQGAKGVIVSITGGEDMRLMEVDEAANHIRELVDPDANIIWGSAFNEKLDGKIRVSVVATGIDTEAPTQDASARSFAFNRAAATPAPEPVSSIFSESEESAPADEAEAETPETDEIVDEVSSEAPVEEAAEDDSLDLGTAEGVETVEADEAEETVSETADETATEESEEADDTLELGGADMAVEGDAEADPAANTDADAPRIASGGGTLFERMSNLSRGITGKDDDDKNDDGDDDSSGGLHIPRFLDRQGNN